MKKNYTFPKNHFQLQTQLVTHNDGTRYGTPQTEAPLLKKSRTL